MFDEWYARDTDATLWPDAAWLQIKLTLDLTGCNLQEIRQEIYDMNNITVLSNAI